jgi:RNA polymerase sigma-54 factor
VGSVADFRTGLAPRLELSPELALHVSPLLVARMHMLALTSVEFEDVVHRELEENPALELVEQPPCKAGGSGTCRVCSMMPWESVPGGRECHPPRPIADVPVPDDPRDDLLLDLKASVDSELGFVADYVMARVDEQGYLNGDLSEIASVLRVPIREIERVIDVLRTIAPPGFAARDVRESLLLQCSGADGNVSVPPLVHEIVMEHLPSIARGQATAVARRLHTDSADVRAALDFIRTHLQARPGTALHPAPWSPPAPVIALVPDVVVLAQERGEGFDVDVVESHRYALRIDRMYRELAQPATVDDGGAGALSNRDRHHVIAQTKRAATFMTRVKERWQTILNVSRYVVEQQAAYLRDGPRSMRSLTRAEVAAAIGVHASTVSRATGGRFVGLPSGEVIPFSDLFDASLGARDVLRQIIASERRAMSDSDLADELARRGHPVARRTVAKYRGRLGLPASAAR